MATTPDQPGSAEERNSAWRGNDFEARELGAAEPGGADLDQIHARQTAEIVAEA